MEKEFLTTLAQALGRKKKKPMEYKDLISSEKFDELRKDLNLFRHIVSTKTELDSRDFGLCPFHNETTPSFHLFNGLDRARFHCFGCGADGDIFTYLQRTEKLNFTLALKRLQILSKKYSGLFFFPSENPEPASQFSSKNCHSTCESYQRLRGDFDYILEENIRLKELFIWVQAILFTSKK